MLLDLKDHFFSLSRTGMLMVQRVVVLLCHQLDGLLFDDHLSMARVGVSWNCQCFFAIPWNLRSSTSWPEESPHRGRRRSHIFRGMFDALGLDSSWWNYTPVCTRMFVACMIFMFLPLRFKEKRHKVPPMDHIFRINGSIVVTTGPQHIFPKDPLNRFKATQIADFL